MKASEIRNLSTEELEAKLKDLKAELFNLRFQLAINQLENPMRVSAVKKDIARKDRFARKRDQKQPKCVRKGGFSCER